MLEALRKFAHGIWTTATGRMGAAYDIDYLIMVVGNGGSGTIVQFSTVRAGTYHAFWDIKRELGRMMKKGLCTCNDMLAHRERGKDENYAITVYSVTPKGMAVVMQRHNFNLWVFRNHADLIMGDLI